MGPTHSPGDDRAVARGILRRLLEARPAVSQPEGHAAHHGADRARGSVLSFVDRSDRHHHRGRPDDDANGGELRRVRAGHDPRTHQRRPRSEEHTSELQSLMRSSYAVFFLKKKKSCLIIHSNTTISNKLINLTTLRIIII